MKNMEVLIYVYTIIFTAVSFSNEILKGDLIVRLEKDIEPTHYDVLIRPSLDNDSFEGMVKIRLEAPNRIYSITLHCDVSILSIVLNDKNIYIYEKIGKYLTISYPMDSGSHVLEINFLGQLNYDMKGFYVQPFIYGDRLHKIAATQFQCEGARSAFPCFDEPSFKATFQITIDRSNIGEAFANYTSLSNMALDTAKSTQYKDVFRSTPKLPTYSLAYIVSDFEQIGDDRFSIWCSCNRAWLEIILQNGKKILEELSQTTNLDYFQFATKMDVIVMPDFPRSGMENWGAVTLRDSIVLLSKEKSTTKEKQESVLVLSHELAHMWFGNLVTMRWWSYVWLNEGLASYFGNKAASKVNKNWKLDEQFIVNYCQKGLRADSFPDTKSLNSPVQYYYDMRKAFSEVSYNKGACLVRMVECIVGSSRFMEVISNYLREWKLETVTPSDFWSKFSDIAGKMESWTNNAGYPLVTVSLTANGVSLKQERFTIDVTQAKHGSLWNIPISYATYANKNFEDTTISDWMTTKTPGMVMQLKNEGWVIFNKLATGFYRVNYEKVLWLRIARSLLKPNFDGIHKINRAQIVDDVFNIAISGRIRISLAIKVVQFLSQEKACLPWVPALRGFAYLKERYPGDEKTGIYLRNHIKILFRNFGTLTVEQASMENDHQMKIHNELILNHLCAAGFKNCVESASKLFRMWTINQKISPDVRNVVFCAVMRDATDFEYLTLWNAFNKTDFHSEATGIIKAFGCAKKEYFLKKSLLLATADNTSVTREQLFVLLRSMLNDNVMGKKTAFSFIRTHANDFSTMYLRMYFKYYQKSRSPCFRIMELWPIFTKTLARAATNSDEKNIVKQLLKLNRHTQSNASIKVTLKIIEKNIKWADANRNDLLNFLSNTKTRRASYSNMYGCYRSFSVYVILLTVKMLLEIV